MSASFLDRYWNIEYIYQECELETGHFLLTKITREPRESDETLKSSEDE